MNAITNAAALLKSSEAQSSLSDTKSILEAGKGNNNINIHTNIDGSVDVTIDGEKHHFTAQEAKNLEIRGGEGDDKITQSGVALSPFSDPSITISGGKGDDEIHGGMGNDNLQGDSGDDTITGSFGDDSIDGGTGDDTISGGFGDDTISGSFGDDDIQGGFGDDTISGSFGDDDIQGGFGDDTISGSFGDNDIQGGFGDDTISDEASTSLFDITGDGFDITESVDQTGSPDADYNPVTNIIGKPDIGNVTMEADQSSTGGDTNNASFTTTTTISSSSTSSDSAGAISNNDDGSIDVTQTVDQTNSPDAEYDPVINVSGNPNIGNVDIQADQSSTGGGTNSASFTPETNISG